MNLKRVHSFSVILKKSSVKDKDLFTVYRFELKDPFASQHKNTVFNYPPVISINSAVINNKPVDYILISRRCVFRAGTRFNVRGVDNEGKVANFVETEQIIIHDGTACSFVQVWKRNRVYLANCNSWKLNKSYT